MEPWIFGDSAANGLVLGNAGTTLVIGPGIVVRGQNGAVGYSSIVGGSLAVSVLNEGTISADVSGGTIIVYGQPFNNQQGQVAQPSRNSHFTRHGLVRGTGKRVQSGGGVFVLSVYLTNVNQSLILPGTNNA